MLNDGTLQAQQEKSLLIVDDDRPFLTRVARAMEQRGYSVATAETVEDGIRAISTRPPAFAVIDMRLGDGSGLDVIAALKKQSVKRIGKLVILMLSLRLMKS